MVAPEVVIDTSVAFKLFVGYGEAGLDQAAALLCAHREQELRLIAPATLPIEIANSLRYLLPDRKDVLGFLSDLESLHVELLRPIPIWYAGRQCERLKPIWESTTPYCWPSPKNADAPS